MNVVLTVVAGPRTGVRLRLRDKSVITLGRSKTTDFHVLDGAMSRVHAVIAFDDGQWWVEDQKSRNGTWIDGRQIEREALESGVVILLGRDTAVRFELEEERAAELRSSTSVAMIPPCMACGEPIASSADLVRTPEGKPFHVRCRNLDHLVGTELGEFKIAETLPALGDAFFFRAHQPSLNRSVMLEVYDLPLTSQPGYRQALLEEVRRVSGFLHPHILQIFSFEEARGMSFVVMEHFRGERLSGVLEQRRFVRIRGAVQVAMHLIEALAYALERGVKLGSISTTPVLVSPEHDVKVKFFEDPALHGRRPLSVRDAFYAAPEAAEGGHASEPALVYSVGAILYHMLAGIPPYEGETPAEVFRRARTESPPALRRINLKVSPALAQAVEKAIERSPADRQQTLADLLAQLRSAG